ncbi:MAG: ABC transporter permease [Vampirovibrio sp.]|nr:ABC transporter permease [Vampirovibrio sp.]
MSILTYIIKRFLIAIPTILAVSVLGFLLMRFDFGTFGPYDIDFGIGSPIHLDAIPLKNPIDPLAELRNNPQISAKALQKEVIRLGLDQPMHVQYWRWVKGVFQVNPEALSEGKLWEFFQPDLGKDYSGHDVARELMSRAKNTLALNLLSVFFAWIIAIPLGIQAALHWRSLFDRLTTVAATCGMALPSFVLALMLAVVAVKTGWLPISGITSANYESLSLVGKALDIAAHLALPVLTLTLLGLAGWQRQMRGNLLDYLQAEYIRTARAKGLPENVVIYKHAVRTAINPLVTMLGFQLAGLLSGSLLVETVLNYPGLGAYIYAGVLKTDTNVVMSSLVMSAILLVAGNLCADILLKIVDPRIELS